jgi:hypothetical protein
MGSPTFEEQSAAEYSVSMLARLTGLDRRTVDKYLEAEGLEIADDSGGAKKFPWLKAVRAFIFCSKGQSSADRRNEAQARMAEVQTAILERKYIPMEEISPVVRSFFSALNAIVQQSNLEDDEKERIFEKAQDCANKLENIA